MDRLNRLPHRALALRDRLAFGAGPLPLSLHDRLHGAKPLRAALVRLGHGVRGWFVSSPRERLQARRMARATPALYQWRVRRIIAAADLRSAALLVREHVTNSLHQ